MMKWKWENCVLGVEKGDQTCGPREQEVVYRMKKNLSQQQLVSGIGAEGIMGCWCEVTGIVASAGV